MAQLSPLQQRFVEQYPIDSNAMQAAIRAGYSAKTAQKKGYQLLKNPLVQQALKEAVQARSRRTGIQADAVIKELALIAFSDIGDAFDSSNRLIPVKSIPPEARRAISSMKVRRFIEGRGDDAKEVEVTEFRLWSKDAALEKLMKHLGILVDKFAPTDPTGKKEYGSDLSEAERMARIAALCDLWRARRAEAAQRNGDAPAVDSLPGAADEGPVDPS